MIALACLAALTHSQVPAPGAARPRVLVLEARPVSLPGGGPRVFRNEVESALKTAGGEIVYPSRAATGPATCAEPACYAALARAAGAAYVMRIDGEYANDGYRLAMELWSERSGDVVKGESLRCEVCTAREMLRAARDQAVLLASRRFREPVEGPASADREPEPVKGPPAPRAEAARVSLAASRETAEPVPPWKRWLPWGAIGAAALGIGWGGYLLGVDGDCTNDPCTFTRNSKRQGWTAIGAGLAMGALGAVGLYVWSTPRIRAAAGVSPSGLVVTGLF
jgi:hypothetical protein